MSWIRSTPDARGLDNVLASHALNPKAMQAGHQEAQKFSTTGRPRKSARRTGRPWKSGSWTRGAG